MSKMRRGHGFVERTITALAEATEHAFYAEDRSRAHGLLQSLDPRVKVPSILVLIVAVAAARKLWVIVGLFAVAVLIAALSRVPVQVLLKRVWIAVLLFTGAIALPALFVTPGRALYHLPVSGWPITAQGLTSAGFLITRVETAATFSALLILCTPWSQVLKALRVLRVPVVVVVILGMTCRYLFLLLETARDMFESRQSRMVGELSGAERRRLASGSVGVLISKSLQLSSDVFLAMQARGFRGEVYLLTEFQTRPLDWVMLALFGALAAAAFRLGR
ncbi:MAG: cobalt ECF transporter T component CbiQ [Terriglobia bacterium]